MSKTTSQTKPDKPLYTLPPAAVQEVFRMDFSDILGIDLWSLPLDIDFMKRSPNYQILDNPLSLEIRSIVQENISELLSTYFTYDEKRFPNPLDHYKWIADSEIEIRSILGRGIDVPFDTTVNEQGELLTEGEPLKHYQNSLLQKRFEKLFELLVNVGEVHKFDPELIALRDDEETETD